MKPMRKHSLRYADFLVKEETATKESAKNTVAGLDIAVAILLAKMEEREGIASCKAQSQNKRS